MPARIAGSGTPRYPPRDYPDHPDPHVRFAHIPSASAREAMADFIPYTPTDDNDQEAIVAEFPASTVIKDAELGRREPIWAHYLPDQLRFEDDHDDTPKDREYIRPSDAGKCARQLGYIACGAEVTDPSDDASILAFAIGGFLHRTWQAGVARLFEEMRADYEAEHGDGAVPGPGIPWTVVIEEHFDRFDTTLTLPPRNPGDPGIEVPIEGYADLVVYDCEGTPLEVDDAKSKGGFGYKKSFKEGVDLGPWTQSWIYGVLKGAERIAVLNLAKENISVNAASKMRDVSETERYANEFTKFTRDWDLVGYKEVARMWGINRLAHEKGMLGKRVIPEYGDGTEVIAPQQGLFENGTTAWQCVGYCSWQQQCVTDGPGRVPIPETSVLAIRMKETATTVTEAFPGTEVQS